MLAARLCPCAHVPTSLVVECEAIVLLVGLYPWLASLVFPKCQRLVASFNTSEDKQVLLKQQFILDLSLDSLVCDSRSLQEGLRTIPVSPGLCLVLWLGGCPDFSGRVVFIRLISKVLGAAVG